jgi:hypothetical protein
MTKRLGVRRTLAIALALAAAAAVPTAASAGTGDGNHCTLPDGTDFNELWGVSETIVWWMCSDVGAGQDWRVAELWGMNETFKKVPKGFVPAGETPLDDFLAKFIGVKVVVDPGTSGERQYLFTDTSKLRVDGTSVNGVTMGVLDPLSVGSHAVEAYWRMSGLHCDGLGRDLAANCLAAGDSLAFFGGVTVSPGN